MHTAPLKVLDVIDPKIQWKLWNGKGLRTVCWSHVHTVCYKNLRNCMLHSWEKKSELSLSTESKTNSPRAKSALHKKYIFHRDQLPFFLLRLCLFFWLFFCVGFPAGAGLFPCERSCCVSAWERWPCRLIYRSQKISMDTRSPSLLARMSRWRKHRGSPWSNAATSP